MRAAVEPSSGTSWGTGRERMRIISSASPSRTTCLPPRFCRACCIMRPSHRGYRVQVICGTYCTMVLMQQTPQWCPSFSSLFPEQHSTVVEVALACCLWCPALEVTRDGGAGCPHEPPPPREPPAPAASGAHPHDLVLRRVQGLRRGHCRQEELSVHGIRASAPSWCRRS